MRLDVHSHLFCSAIEFLQWYKMGSRTREEENINSDGDEGIANKKIEGKIKVVFEV